MVETEYMDDVPTVLSWCVTITRKFHKPYEPHSNKYLDFGSGVHLAFKSHSFLLTAGTNVVL